MGYDPDQHGPNRVVGPGFHERVFAIVQRVPRGRVTTYGDVAAALGLRRAARHVGYALATLGGRVDVPWFRVVNARGRVSFPPDSDAGREQRKRLAKDGVTVTADGRVEGFAGRRWSE